MALVSRKDVERAIQHLEDTGQSISPSAVLRLTGGRKEFVLRLVRELRGLPEAQSIDTAQPTVPGGATRVSGPAPAAVVVTNAVHASAGGVAHPAPARGHHTTGNGLSRLAAARHQYHRCCDAATEAHAKLKPIADAIARYEARLQELTAARERCIELEQLRLIKARMLDAEENLEILRRAMGHSNGSMSRGAGKSRTQNIRIWAWCMPHGNC
jgi:hypothetical protein